MKHADEVAIENVEVSVYRFPIQPPHSDGTISWDSITCVVVEVSANGYVGVGYTYGDRSVATFINSQLRESLIGRDVHSVVATWQLMNRSVRNAGRVGVGSMAIAAVDNALWDLAARHRELPLYKYLGAARSTVEIYGSGGFTSFGPKEVAKQLGDWAEAGIRRVKMKVGRHPAQDCERVRAAREAIGDNTELMVDANGAYTRKQALRWADKLAHDYHVSWCEEPVSSDDLEGLRLIRDRGPSGMSIAAGEYGWDLAYFHHMLAAGAVDVLQADVTRCGGYTNLRAIDGLCKARSLPLSLHCAPSAHVHFAAALESFVHCEYFADHADIEAKLFDGTLSPSHGVLTPDNSRIGNGLELKHAEVANYLL